ncbi:hypothetical protein FSARC_15066, partial [Fusarium sarcochroum]
PRLWPKLRYEWTLLPPEIRLLILDYLLPATKHGAASVASYAAVCLEWQHYFERFSFRLLRLLELSVQLSEYDCPDYKSRESPNTTFR